MQIGTPLRVGHEHDVSAQEADQIDARLSVRQTCVFLRQDRTIQHRLATHEIQPVVADIELALWFVPGDHDTSPLA